MANRTTSFRFYTDVNLNPSTNDTFYFASASDQAAFFSSKLVTTVSNCYYQRADVNKVKVEKPYSTLYRCDYLSFTNPAYENKTFYAFITNVTYIDDNTTEVNYVIDQFQTWFLSLTWKPCLVERQHSNRDTWGDNLLMENLDCGKYVTGYINDSLIDSDMLVIVHATFDIVHWLSTSSHDKVAPSTFNKQGVYDQLSQAAFYSTKSSGSATAGTGSALQVFINSVFDGIGGVTLDDIVDIYCYPKVGVLLDSGETVIGTSSSLATDFQKVFNVGGAYMTGTQYGQDYSLPAVPATLNGYRPKNNKMFQYPYCLVHISNNDGSSIDLHYERFHLPSGADPHSTTAFKVKVQGTSCGDAKLRISPLQYMGIVDSQQVDFDQSLDSGSYPTCSMTGDAYNIYLAQNKNRIVNNYQASALKGVADTLNTTSGRVTQMGGLALSSMGEGFGTGSVGSKGGTTWEMQSLQFAADYYMKGKAIAAAMEDMQIAPGTTNGVSGVGLAFQNNKKNFTIQVKTVDAQHAELIDDYYTMFGYPMRKIMVPMLKARTKFTYIKTVGCIVWGNVPENAKAFIQNMFDTGIRLWADADNIGNFNVQNDPINS